MDGVGSASELGLSLAGEDHIADVGVVDQDDSAADGCTCDVNDNGAPNPITLMLALPLLLGLRRRRR